MYSYIYLRIRSQTETTEIQENIGGGVDLNHELPFVLNHGAL